MVWCGEFKLFAVWWIAPQSGVTDGHNWVVCGDIRITMFSILWRHSGLLRPPVSYPVTHQQPASWDGRTPDIALSSSVYKLLVTKSVERFGPSWHFLDLGSGWIHYEYKTTKWRARRWSSVIFCYKCIPSVPWF